MPLSQTSAKPYLVPYRAADFTERLREIDMFFQGNGRVHETMRRVARKLEEAGLPYAVVGGMAVNAHGHARTTGDVDFLVTSDSFNGFLRLVESGDFSRIAGRPRRFLDPVSGVTFDFLVTGMFPGSGKPGPISYPDPQDVRQTIKDLPVVNLATLIQLKLAARRYQDFADVVNLVAVHNLDERFQQHLHPSVRGDYIECLEEKRREDEYEARQDEQFEQKTRGAGEGRDDPPSGGGATEAELLKRINEGTPAQDWERYRQLILKRRAETLTPEQHQELIALSNRIEEAHARRMSDVAELARLRGVDLDRLMKELGLGPVDFRLDED